MRLFCTDCGELVELRRGYLLLYGYGRCRKCAKIPFPGRLLTLVLCTLLAFYLGKLTSAPCIKPIAINSSATVTKTPVRAKIERVCGAQTRSGRRCRRKVREEGYCWQHKKLEKDG